VDALVVEQLRDVERKIAGLRRLRAELDRLVSQCRIIKALSLVGLAGIVCGGVLANRRTDA